MGKMPAQKPGKSRQDVGTPREFLDAVEDRFGFIRCDLAASEGNAVCPDFFGPNACPEGTGLGTLSPHVSWSVGRYDSGLLWLNPEFADIEPYAKKCWEESRQRRGLIALLTPAGVGTNWYERWVHRKAFVLALRPRLTFVGETHPFPKDLTLSLYGYGFHGFDTWRWKGEDR